MLANLHIHSPSLFLSLGSLLLLRRPCPCPLPSKPIPRPPFPAPPSFSTTHSSASAPIDNGASFDDAPHTTSRQRSSNPQPEEEKHHRSWFGPNGQYIRELPCPNCRGRGYSPCTECGIDRPRSDCSTCNGKGKTTCPQCRGDCVIWEEFIDEQPWEKARSRSPLKVKEDDEVDNLEIKLDDARKSRRVYKSPSREVIQKIRQSLKSLNEKTGLFTRHMKIIHRDPILRAQRIASIKKAKGAPEARKKTSEVMKIFFSDPENRRKRSLSMKGVKFFCSHCGEEGHRKFYCPMLKHKKGAAKFSCSLCGKTGHNRRSCSSKAEGAKFRCSHCGKEGHRKSYCPELRKTSGPLRITCGLCGGLGHNRRTCTNKSKEEGKKGKVDKDVD